MNKLSLSSSQEQIEFKRRLCKELNLSDSMVHQAVKSRGKLSDNLLYKDVLVNPTLNMFISLLYANIKSKISVIEFDRAVEKVIKSFEKIKQIPNTNID